MDIVYWEEVDGETTNHWIYVTGWVTEMDGNDVKGTRFATFRYNAADPGSGGVASPDKTAYFPPLATSLTEGDTYRAVAMDIDPKTGDIYILGEGPAQPGGSDQDYVVIKYDKVLDLQWSGDGARYYDGPLGGDEIPVDIAVAFDDNGDAQAVVATGTSPETTGYFAIATVAWLTNGNPASSFWPSDGVRRYKHHAEWHDTAVELGGARVPTIEEASVLTVLVLGNSQDPTTGTDFTLHQWYGTSSSVHWEARYDNGLFDLARGLAVDAAGEYAYVTGRSAGTSSFDFTTISYLVGGTEPEWVEQDDYVGESDQPNDIYLVVPPSGDRQVWVTGVAQDGTFADAFTVRYLDDLSGSVSGVWAEGFGVSSAQESGIAMTVFEDEPYIAGVQGTSSFDKMLALAYYQDSPYTHNWDRTFNGPYIGADSNAGRGVVVAVVQNSDNDRSIYVVGVSTESGEGRQFTLWRYKEE